MDIFAQAIGIVAMVINIASYQFKTNKQIVLANSIASILFSVNYLLLGATMGGILNMIAVARGAFVVFSKKNSKVVLGIFLSIVVAMYVLTFTVFGKEPTLANFLIELLPTAGMLVQTVAFFLFDAKKIRYFSYFSSPCWLAYNIISFTIGGIVCECFALVSITVGILRYRKNKKCDKIDQNTDDKNNTEV